MGKTKTAFVGNEENKNEEKHSKAHKGEEEKVHISGLKGGQRVKMVGAESTEEAPVFEEGKEGVEKEDTKKVVEKVRSQKYKDSKAKIDVLKNYPLKDAVKLVKSTSYSKFDGTMELHLVVKKAGTSVQVTLPHSAGREKKVEIASDETIEKLKKGVVDFDILISTPQMMPKLVPFARILGPKGLMPNPKNGTLINDPKKVKSFSSATVTLKTEKDAPLIHTVVGKNSQDDSEIVDNTNAILNALGGSKQIIRAYLKSTMSPSVKLQLS